MDEDAARPEELLNSYVKLRIATGKIASGLGVLALLWSTVVLLGGFVSDLPMPHFWIITVLSFVMACNMVDISENEISKGIYLEESRIIHILGRHKWTKAYQARSIQIMLRVVYVPKVILLFCLGLVFQYESLMGVGSSLVLLVLRDYGDAGVAIDKRDKLRAALDIFYGLALLQSLAVTYWTYIVVTLIWSIHQVTSVTNKQCGFDGWGSKVIRMYASETRRKLNKDGELPGNWNLMTYAVGLLQSASGGDDDHLWGARILDTLFAEDDKSVRQELLSSRLAILNLMAMIGRRGAADNIEKRERAARIVARHLASDLQITLFQGTLQCTCSLLFESCNHFCPSPEKNPDEQSRYQLETSVHQHDAHILVPIQDRTDHEQEQVDASSSSAGLAQRKQTTFLQRLKEGREHHQQRHEKAFSNKEIKKQHNKDIKEWRRYTYRSRGAKELISHGLLILERLAQDEENCAEISKHQRLLSKITSPLSSPDFLSNTREDTMVEMLGKSLTVVSRLLTSHGDCITRLRQELASNTEAVSNLMAILETDSEGAQQLHQQALEILTELAFDDSFKKLEFNKLFKALLRIFLEEEASNTIVEESSNTKDEMEEADRDKATRLIRGKAGEALARLLLLLAARDANVADILSRQEAIHLLTKVLNQILSSKMGTTTDAVKNAVKRSITEMEALVTKVFNKKMWINVPAKAAYTKMKNQVAEEVINQILCSEVGTITDAARRAFTKNENLPTKVLDELLSTKMETTMVGILQPLIQEIEKRSEERKFLAAILSVAVVICNENVINKEEFAHATPEDTALVKKLKEILKVNKQCTAECLRVVKLTCHMVIAMIQAKPSCIQYFNEHNFKEALTEALGTMSEVDNCLLFAGNDREVIKPARSLASLVKKAQQLLKAVDARQILGGNERSLRRAASSGRTRTRGSCRIQRQSLWLDPSPSQLAATAFVAHRRCRCSVSYGLRARTRGQWQQRMRARIWRRAGAGFLVAGPPEAPGGSTSGAGSHFPRPENL